MMRTANNNDEITCELKTIYLSRYVFPQGEVEFADVANWCNNMEAVIATRMHCESETTYACDIVNGLTGEVYAIRNEIGLWDILDANERGRQHEI